MKIALISCSSRKSKDRCKAEDMYQSALFKKSLALAKKKGYDEIFILSAKYGLLKLTDVIDTYNVTLNDIKNHDIKEWADRVKEKLPEGSEIDYYAGINYRKYLPQGNVIWRGGRIGKILHNLDVDLNQTP